ncbi:uncharacterized protein LOC141604981 [Silene latifolia]|uniref:uncharacterized protein LOC141604981 n=1 Tax=Silene latifolia TaxID=37657 RepID=UPI003D76F804
MVKKRTTSESTRRRNRVDSSTRPTQSTNSSPSRAHNRQLTIIITIIFFIVSSAISILVYRHSRPSSTSSPHLHHNNNLFKTDVDYQEIINENSRVSENVTQRHFGNSVLAYITPWNSAGYDLAKKFSSKFTHLSPVWYDLKSQGTKLRLEGRHNADAGWLSEIRRSGNTKVLPRVVLEVLPKDLFGKKKQRDKAIDVIVTECKDMDYDGVVLESWSRWAAYGILHDASIRKMALEFVNQLGDALHKVRSQRNGQQLQLVFVIGPRQSENLQAHDFGPEDLRALSDSVDGFSLMTYDFSSSYRPGPNAPLLWVRSTIEFLLSSSSNNLASKVLVGINFYGNDFDLTEGGGGAQAITGRDYLSLLDRYKPKIEWQDEIAEHFFLYSDDQNRQHAVFYPTPMSISKRLEEAHSWGTGISIWEIGQGLDFFFDLL